MDAVLVEGIHQFQAKCFFETGQIDGKAGESTLDSLGLVKRRGMNSVDRRHAGAHDRLGQVDVAGLTSNEFTADTWFDHMVNPSFLGWRFLFGGTPRGVHLSFMRKLRTAERALLAQSKFSAMTPVELGRALGFSATSEEHKGARPDRPTTSMHTYGLAVDIKYTGNPWVIGADFLAALQHSALLMSGIRITQGTSQRFLHDLGADPTGTTAAIFDTLAQRNRDFRDYLALALPANAAGLEAVLQRRRAGGTAGVFARPTESIADAARRWRTHIQHDLGQMRAVGSPFFPDEHTTPRDPLLGFLNLDRDLVIALRDTACLAWGAVDFGHGPLSSGDIMHFDDRVCGIGHALARVGGNTPPRSGHPCIACGPPAASHEEPEAFNGGDFETERPAEIYHSPVPYPDVSRYEDPNPYAEPAISTEPTPRPASALRDPSAQPSVSGELDGPPGGSARAYERGHPGTPIELQVQQATPAAPGSHAMVAVFGQRPEGYLFVPVADMVAGIDVSHHQGRIDWARVAASGTGFAYIKATEGATGPDSHDGFFRSNWAGALANGIPRGAYHLLTRPSFSSARAQARNFLNHVALQAGDLPPALDVETRTVNLMIQDVGVANAWRHIWEWCEIVQTATDYQPLLYMGKTGIDALSPHVGSLSALDLWMPRYRPIHRLPPLPADAAGNLIFPHWTFWQHSERGAVPGIHGHVDLDLFNGNARNFTQWITSVQHHPL